MEIEEFLAKDNGETLINHSKRVSEFAVAIAKQSNGSVNENILEVIRVGGLLHDIGKIKEAFQTYLTKNIKVKFKFKHNETGWAFLVKYLKVNNSQDLNNIFDVVYWHHAIGNVMNEHYYDEILDELSEVDIDNMILFVKRILGESFIRDEPFEGDIKTPQYYAQAVGFDEIDNNYEKIFIRSCIISADRIVSNISVNTTPEEYLENVIFRSDVNINIAKVYGSFPSNERYEKQLEIVDEANLSKTVIIKAPAGFGKTLVGLLWNFKRTKKLVWVCPRNLVAESVYHSVIEELGILGINLNVELFYGDEIKQTNHSSEKGFDSDIIITNIDNFLKPSIDNGKIDNLFLINNCDVIFDEYHELVGEAALFACFINIMKCRNKLTLSKTLLLSATPIEMSFLWNTLNNRTVTLPEQKTHYPAIHKGTYKIVIDDEMVKSVNGNTLYLVNTISSSQRLYQNFGLKKIIHSHFESKKRSEIFDDLMKNYGKTAKGDDNKVDVVGTHILQASLDISFKELKEMTLSPESTMQRIGRCNRWGEYKNESILHFINDGKNSDKHIVEALYNKELRELWFNYISMYNGKNLTLDELYVIYNSFSEKNKKAIEKHIKNAFRNSCNFLANIYPRQYFNKKNSEQLEIEIIAGGNKLRKTSKKEIFFTAKNSNGIGYCEPFTQILHNEFSGTFKEHKGTQRQIERELKFMFDNEIFDYHKTFTKYAFKKKNMVDLLRAISNSNQTPYIRFDKVYDPELGLITI